MSAEDDLPSWDEFGAEQLDYGEEEEEVAAPGDDPGDPGEEPSCSTSSASASQAAARAAPAARAVAASSSRAAAGAERDIGPSLPPGFDLGGGAEEAEDDDDEEEVEDPEDPGDPGMPQAVVDEAELAPTLPSVGGPLSPIDEPTVPAAPVAAVAAAAAAAPPAPVPRRSSSSHSYGPAAPPPEPAPRPTRAAAPPARVVGPAMPPDLLPFEANGGDDQEEDEEGGREEEEEDDDAYGPALPPGMNGGGGGAMAGSGGGGSEMEMPTMDEEEDDSEVIGPMPARADGSEERAAELRRAYLKAEKEREDKKVKREEWMLQLPKKLTSYGLGPRSFSKSNGTDGDSSAWTNGPGTSAADQPGTSKEAMEKLANAQRDSHQERIASSLNAGRNESMLDSHSRKRKVEEEEVAGPSAPAVRRPFDIEKDMQVRGLKSATPAEIKEKCGALSSRFGNSGSTSKYL